MIDVDKLLGRILNASQGETFAGGLLVGGLAGAMTGKTGKKIAGTALKVGGAAAVAGLAYTAYQRYKAGQPIIPGMGGQATSRVPQTPPPAQGRDDIIDITPLQKDHFLPAPNDAQGTQTLSLKLIRAMIAAAKADGQIDSAETGKIFGQIDALGLNHEEKSFLLAEIGKPLGAREVAAMGTTPEEAAELYAASVMAVNPHGLAEKLYLGELERLLKLEPALAKDIHDRVLVPAG